ncbi:MAG: hypothetical protein HYX73_10960 [Acidobacteria bacterium]|nr:hypothetical protein [Acidobacteriota bacterium]
MNCNDVRPVLLDYVIEEVPVPDRAVIAQHLETCAACSEEVGKVRQTLGVLAQDTAFEEIPQKIRIVAEPANRLVAFWRNPARLAFAGGALACLAIAMLALARTTISYQHGNFEIAFGAAVESTQSPAAAPAATPSSMNLVPAVSNQAFTREEAVKLIAEAVAASEERQTAGTARILKAAADQAETNRMNDRHELAESFRYFQAAQVNMWKQQVENQQVVSALMQRTGVEILPRP